MPTVADRIAQTVAALTCQPARSGSFTATPMVPARPLGAARAGGLPGTVLKRDWVLDIDICTFFDSLNHDLGVKALWANMTTEQRWVPLYVERWLTHPAVPRVRSQGALSTPVQGFVHGTAGHEGNHRPV